LINKGMPWLKPRVEYQAMLAQELEAMRGASLLLHLNAQEAQDFRALLPQMSHELLYPATPPAPTGPGGPDIIIVASNNTANVESVIWFLRERAADRKSPNQNYRQCRCRRSRTGSARVCRLPASVSWARR
jgi:hypothetical protein